MVLYTKNLSEPWFTLIRDEVKTCEGRLKKGDFLEMKPGDHIRFQQANNLSLIRITSLKHYPTFYRYLQMEGLQSCLPGVDSLQEGVNIYRQFYTQEEESIYGVVAIRFVLESENMIIHLNETIPNLLS
jgi:ASC-1-like (ASCH) protein